MYSKSLQTEMKYVVDLKYTNLDVSLKIYLDLRRQAFLVPDWL